MDLEKLLKDVENLSVRIGDELKEKRKSSFKITVKSLNNFVTELDQWSEEEFVKGLRELIPNSRFIAEEGYLERPKQGVPTWIIDPIDGTTNFIHNVPLYCTSVGLMVGQRIVLGVIYDPSSKELFSAALNFGAYLNGERISVSKTKDLPSALIATGFPYDDMGMGEEYINILSEFTSKTRGIRRLGSAALDMAYVAAGRFDAFYEYGLNPWDVAAGIVIIEEAGGKCSAFDGTRGMLFGEELIATNKLIHPDMQKVLNNFFGK